MNRFRSSLAVKWWAAILTVMMIITFAVSALAVGICSVMEVYSKPDNFKEKAYCELAYMEANKVYNYFYSLDNETIQEGKFELPDFLSIQNTNLRFFVTDSKGNRVLANAEVSAKDRITNTFSLELSRTSHTESRSYNRIEDASEFFSEMESPTKQLVSYQWETGNDEAGTTIHILTVTWEEITQVEYVIDCVLSDSFTIKDSTYFYLRLVDAFVSIRWAMTVIAPSSLLLIVMLVIYLCWASGYRKGSSEPSLNLIDQIPLDVYLLIWVGMIVSAVLLCVIFAKEVLDIGNLDLMVLFAVVIGIAAIFLSSLLLSLILTVASRIKCGTLLYNTIVWRVLRLFWKGTKAVFGIFVFYIKNLHLYKKTAVIILILLGLELVALLSNSIEFIVGCCIFANLFLIPIAVYCIIQYQKLTEATARIAKGDTSYQIDTTGLVLELKSHAEFINGIGAGMQIAVDERMKSERFKTELITNVSHDIKTPLTSIINYVDLLKKEEISSISAKEYIDVLARQSARLKKLIEDLMEASKASTGNLPVHMEPINLNLLIAQTTAEFYQKLEAKDLTVVTNLTADQNCSVVADGRLLWRVLENLMSNVCKYAQEKTRLYISTEVCGNSIRLILKNTSKYALNVSSEELMERFTRGDASRHTEGSGLGLSIARSLVELQHGRLNVVIDGDLFKVIIELPKQ